MHAKFDNDPRVEIYPCALSDHTEERDLMVSDGDGQGSTFLRQINPHYVFSTTTPAKLVRFDDLGINLDGFDTLVADTQGMEMEVLKGFGDELQKFKFLNIECSNPPLYENSASADEIIAFLAERGFVQDSEMVVHDDIMFVRKGLKP
jgi:FkbM family methyltransferase